MLFRSGEGSNSCAKSAFTRCIIDKVGPEALHLPDMWRYHQEIRATVGGGNRVKPEEVFSWADVTLDAWADPVNKRKQTALIHKISTLVDGNMIKAIVDAGIVVLQCNGYTGKKASTQTRLKKS